MKITVYPSLYDIDTWHGRTVALGDFESWTVTDDKLSAPGFSPVVLEPPPVPCSRHRGEPRIEPHRCDLCVTEVQAGVFDVDQGTCEDVTSMSSRLDIEYLLYSSHSFPDKPSFRLVLPFTRPVPAEGWVQVRRKIIDHYRIPADPKQCAGLSHFYFLPSHRPGVEPLFHHVPGPELDPGRFPYTPRMTDRDAAWETRNWAPPPMSDTPVNVAALKDVIRTRRNTIKDPDLKELANRLLKGRALAEHGHRNEAMTRAANWLSWVLPDVAPGVLLYFLRPSLDAMTAAGSSLTEDQVESMIVRAQRKYVERRLQDAAIGRVLNGAARALTAR